jgi:hypothetical protein
VETCTGEGLSTTHITGNSACSQLTSAQLKHAIPSLHLLFQSCGAGIIKMSWVPHISRVLCTRYGYVLHVGWMTFESSRISSVLLSAIKPGGQTKQVVKSRLTVTSCCKHGHLTDCLSSNGIAPMSMASCFERGFQTTDTWCLEMCFLCQLGSCYLWVEIKANDLRTDVRFRTDAETTVSATGILVDCSDGSDLWGLISKRRRN